MTHKDEKYGIYFGELIDASTPDFYLSDHVTDDLIVQMAEAGAINMKFDIEENERYSDTLFFETNEHTDYPTLMVLVATARPHEFSQETPNCFRMWWD